MKVQVTYDLDDNQLLALGLIHTGRFERPSQKEARSYLLDSGMAMIDSATVLVVDHEARAEQDRLQVAEDIKEQLGFGTAHGGS